MACIKGGNARCQFMTGAHQDNERILHSEGVTGSAGL